MRALLVGCAVALVACGPLAPPRPDSGSGGGEATGGGTGTTGGGMSTGGGGGTTCACTAPENAMPRCSDAGCDFVCNSGFHRCGAHCAADDSVNECGAACEVCPANGGIASCVANACDFNCGANQARCNGQCVTESNSACGTGCEVCGSGASCVGGACRLQCPPGEIEVNGRCAEGRELAAGQLNACVVHDGGVVCWGPGSTGMLGRGVYDGGRSPDFVSNIGDVASLATGDHFGCVLLPSGAVRCWGDNALGQVGNGGTQPAFTPALTVSGDVTTLAAGWRHACVNFTDGGVSCWGSGSTGQLGNGMTPLGVRSPQSVPLDAGIRTLFSGNDGNWALARDGGVIFWGYDSLGSFSSSPRPLFVTDGGVKRIVAATNHACAIRADNRELECWGRGAEGQLGYAVAMTNAQPVRVVPSLGPVTDVCTGLNFTCALVDDGGVRCFGNGTNGELGGGNYVSSSAPVIVDSLPAAKQIACHHQFACAKTLTAVYCWGDNSYGQLGAPSPMSSASPVPVPLP